MKRQLQKRELDTESLIKGDSIDTAEIERVTGAKYGTMQFQFQAMQLAQKIMTERPEMVARIDRGNIRILEDGEASEYCNDRYNAHYNGMRRANQKAGMVDRAQLTDEERRTHDKRVQFQGAVLAAAMKEAKKFKIDYSESTRATPAHPTI